MVAQLIIILIILGLGVYLLSSGTDFFSDISADAEEREEKQEDSATPTIQDRGNVAADTTKEVCDLEITWYGTFRETDPFGFDPIGIFEQRFVFIGDQTHPISGLEASTDTRTFTYRWYNCSGGQFNLSFLDLFRNNLIQNNRLDTESLSIVSPLLLGGSLTDREVIRIHFEGLSLNFQGKFLFDAEGKGIAPNEFQASTTLPRGALIPHDFTIRTVLKDVTHDDYLIEYWIEDFRLNAQAPGARFNKDLCQVGLSSC